MCLQARYRMSEFGKLTLAKFHGFARLAKGLFCIVLADKGRSQIHIERLGFAVTPADAAAKCSHILPAHFVKCILYQDLLACLGHFLTFA